VAKENDEIVVNLRDPFIAGILAWLLPGAGHWYQHRRAKAVIFFVCIFGTFMYGMFLGEGRVVYAQWEGPEFRRYPFICQVAVGLPSLPAVVLAWSGGESFFGTRWYVPPTIIGGKSPELDDLHLRLNRRFELGTVFTMIAGLLNVLAIYDAVCGPAYSVTRRSKKEGDDAAPTNSDGAEGDSPEKQPANA
jgi:hypothetical protein